MSLYLEDGLLKFQFSCGVQTMLFSEVQIRVNNGFDINILAMVELVPLLNTSLHCVASLRINNTLVMSGEQVAMNHRRDDFNSGLYLGGIPTQVMHMINSPVTTGMTGCVSSLQVPMSLFCSLPIHHNHKEEKPET
uniref:Protein eyes shut n=1 Tax=Cacopsylla melanoneura TaxID=428564 RepID=A0A8D8ZB33_9HEMI